MAEEQAYLQRLYTKLVWNKRANSGPFAQHLYKNLSDWSGPNESGEIVSVDRGSKLSAVFTAINGISQDIAKLPLSILKDSQDGSKEIRKTHPVHRLISTCPNEHMGAFNFWYCMMFNALRHKSTALIVREGGIPVELLPFEYESLARSKDGSVFYEYNQQMIPERDVFHLKMYTLDGYESISPITWNAELMGYRMKTRKYATKVIGNTGTGFISSEGIGEEEGQKLADNIKDSLSKGTIPFVGSQGKTTWNRQLITPEEGQYLETSKKGDRDILAIYRYPPALAGDLENGTYSNTEQQDLVYTKYTLTPWARLIEDEIDRKLLPESNKVASFPFYSRYDFKGMLRGDLTARKEYYQVMKDGILSPDEIRALEDYGPTPGGDKVQKQGANVALDEVTKLDENNE